MPTLKFTVRGVQFEYLGTQDELNAFIDRFLGNVASLPQRAEIDHREPYSEKRAKRKTQEVEPLRVTDLPLPSDEAIVDYIISKPQYAHDILEIQMKFFGRTFSSRGEDQRMYFKTSRQLRAVREAIEKRYNGKFGEEPAGKRNLKRFVFQRASAPALASPFPERQTTSQSSVRTG